MDEFQLKIVKALHRIEDIYYSTKGACYISFSGGKDSTVILALAKMCVEQLTLPQNAIKAVFCDTGVELQATKDFVNWCKDNWYSNIEIIKPKTTFDWVLKNKGKPLKSKLKSQSIGRYQRNKREDTLSYQYMLGKGENGKSFARLKIADKDLHFLHNDFDIQTSSQCCDYLKKKPFEDYNKEHDIEGYILGIRNAEGGARALNAEKRIVNGGKLCTATKGKYTIKMPIIDWTEEEVDRFIEEYNVPLSKAYTEYGLKRTGCMGCPFAMEIAFNLEVLYKHEPSRYRASMYWLKDVYIAQNVVLPFDKEYEQERIQMWDNKYFRMRNEMLMKHRPNSKLLNNQMSIFDIGLENG